jgi:hypothetical protein
MTPPRSEVSSRESDLVRLLDVAVEVSGHAVVTAASLGHRVRSAGRPVVHLVLRPPLVPRRHQPATWLNDLARHGGARRDELYGRLSALLDLVVPGLVAQVMRRVDPADVIHRYVDVDGIIADVDIDSVLSRVDVVALVKEVIDELDLPELIRESTSAMASDSVRGLRMHSISGDDAIGRAVGRLRLRRPATNGAVTSTPDGSPETTAP